MWLCSPQPIITINNAHIKPISIYETYKYLGILIDQIDNRNNNIVNNIATKLIYISQALLKPQQRMHLLKYHLTPSFLYQMVFTCITQSSLKSIYMHFRTFVKRWMRLPKDTNLAVSPRANFSRWLIITPTISINTSFTTKYNQIYKIKWWPTDNIDAM